MSSPLTVKIISQDNQLVETQAQQVTAPTMEGEITVLPGHQPLFAKLVPGELIYKHNSEEHLMLVSGGFIDVTPDNQVTILVDAVKSARDISLEKAEAAIKAAQSVISASQDQQEIIMAEASLRQAMLEVKVAQKSRKRNL